MPKYDLKSDAKQVSSEGFLKGEIQVFSHVTVNPEYKVFNNLVPEINAGKWGIGKFLFATGIGPCMAVCAKLKNGDYALYHANQPFDCEALQEFVVNIKNKGIEDIYIFEKTKGKNYNHPQKIPYLVVTLHKALQKHHIEIEPKRLPVASYSVIIADAQNKRVILTSNFNTPAEEAQLTAKPLGELIPLTIAIPMKKSLADIGEENLHRTNLMSQQSESVQVIIHDNKKEPIQETKTPIKPEVTDKKKSKPNALAKMGNVIGSLFRSKKKTEANKINVKPATKNGNKMGS